MNKFVLNNVASAAALLLAGMLVACSDLGSRDNPTDPASPAYISYSSNFSSSSAQSCGTDVTGAYCYINGIKTYYEYYSSSSAYYSYSSSSVTGNELHVCTYRSASGSLICSEKTYRTVTVGMKVWMAENLTYADSGEMKNLRGGNVMCYGGSADSCTKYGHLYTWAGAMDLPAAYSTAVAAITLRRQGVCPVDWHLPTSAEWDSLAASVGGASVAGTALKSMNEWFNSGNGTDLYGFGALPGGYCCYNGNYDDAGKYAYFWSATENDASYAYFRHLYYGDAEIHMRTNFKTLAFSVRCVKD